MFENFTEPPPRSNRKAMPRWGEKGSYKFVKLYRKHECLWNAKHPFYKNRRKRNEAFKRIANEMDIAGLTAVEVPKKIKNLRTTYYQLLTRIEKSSETDKPYTPSVKWFYDMEYILKNNNSAEKPVTSNTDETEPDVRYFSVSTKGVDEVTDDFPAERKPVNVKVAPVATFVPPSVKMVGKHQHKKNTRVIENPPEPDLSATSTKNSSFVFVGEDECDVIGRHVAMQLRNLNPDELIDANLEIQHILAKYRKRRSQSITVLYPLL